MRRSTFKRPKMVLIFNGAQVLVAVTRSLHSAAELTKGNLQAISFCCTGKYVCSGGLYFRHLHPDVEIELADLGTLMLKDYDALCGEKRTYYPVRKMAHKRALLENKRKSDNQKKGGNTGGEYENHSGGMNLFTPEGPAVDAEEEAFIRAMQRRKKKKKRKGLGM